MTIPSSESHRPNSLRIGIAQMNCTVSDLEANLEKIEENVERAVQNGVDLVVFPELALTGYPVGSWYSEASITAQSEELERLKELSRKVAIVVGVIEETPGVEFFNTGLYLADGEVHHLHRKIYLPTYRDFDERRYFMAGWTVSAFDTPWGRMAILICGDCWHLTLPYLAVHDGADVLLVLAASSKEGLTGEISSANAWERMNRSYALTLSTFVVFANHVGPSGSMEFWGGSHVVLPNGNLHSQASFEREELLTATLDLNLLRKQRLILPFRRDDSLVLTTELGREILHRKQGRYHGFLADPVPSAGSVGAPATEPPFLPIGSSEIAVTSPEEFRPDLTSPDSTHER